MLKFTVSGRITEVRELKTSKDKGERVWRLIWKLAYEGGAADIAFEADDNGRKIWQGCNPGDEVEVSGHITQNAHGATFVYGSHSVATAEDKAVASLISAGFTEQQARAMLSKAPKGDAKGAA